MYLFTLDRFKVITCLGRDQSFDHNLFAVNVVCEEEVLYVDLLVFVGFNIQKGAEIG